MIIFEDWLIHYKILPAGDFTKLNHFTLKATFIWEND